MKTKFHLLPKALLFFLLIVLQSNFSSAQQVAKGLTAANNQFIGFYEYKPTNYTTATKYPLIIFLHGIGERGNGTTQLSAVLNNAIPKYISQGHTMTFTYNGVQSTFLVLSPQLSASYGNWQNFYVDEMIKYAKANLSVDTSRIYLAGLSLGGGGVWGYSTASGSNASQLAAIAPCCGTGDGTNFCNLTNNRVGVWAFHAMDDGVVGVGNTQNAQAKIQACDPDYLAKKFTYYSDGGHNIWDRAFSTDHTYDDPNVYEWFLSQRRNTRKDLFANAGPDITILSPTSTARLNGTGSIFADGVITAYNWTIISGPSTPTIATPNAVKTDISNLAKGVYKFRLQVTGNNGLTVADTVQVTVATPVVRTDGFIGPLSPAWAACGDRMPTNNHVYWTGVLANGTVLYSDPAKTIPYNADWQNFGFAPNSGNAIITGKFYFSPGGVVSGFGSCGYNGGLEYTSSSGPSNQAPTAKAGNDITITLPINSVSLDGTSSTDADGTITGYSWTKISGPSTPTIATANASTTNVNGLVQGLYAFRLQVTDNIGDVGSDTIQVTVLSNAPPPNQAPTAKAGNDITITLPINSVSLDGTASTDADGTITGYSWTKISGPSTPTIATANASTTNVNGLVQGVYAFRLQVTDNNGATGADTVQVNVLAAPLPNQLPIAIAGSDIALTLPEDSIYLNGWSSNDPDGVIASYLWKQLSGPSQINLPTANTVATWVKRMVVGTYQFSLTVTDNQGATASDTLNIYINPAPNKIPTAKAGNDITITLPINSVSLDGAASTDADGTITGYSWTKISGPSTPSIATANASTTNVIGLIQGVYTFRLQVTDNNGATGTDTVQVTVLAAPPPPNQAPTAKAGNDITITLPTNSVSLDGTASTDADGTISAYSWTKISGPSNPIIATANASTTSVTNLLQGVYSFRLQVTDNNGATGTDTVQVTVLAAPPPPNQAPTAKAGNDITITLPTNSVSLDGTASTDADGTITGYSWTKISGPSTPTIATANASTTSVNGLVQGVYTFRLQVTDNNGATGADTVQVTVLAAPLPPNQAPIAKAGNDITITLPINSVNLDGSASTDADGTITAYSWTKISGPSTPTIATANASTTSVNGLVQGVYAFRLQVTDNNGATGADTVQVTVLAAPLPPNQAPIAKAGNDITITLPTNSVSLDGTASTDADGTITGYSWTKISGPSTPTIATANASTTSVNGLVQGVYAFRLQVTDNNGATGADTVQVTVLAAPLPPNQAPTAKAGKDITIALPATSVNLDGSLSTDADGKIVKYKWAQISGSITARLVSADSNKTLVDQLNEGEYKFELTVTDNQGAIGKDTVIIAVVNNLRANEMFTLYPNPVQDIVTIQVSNDYLGKIKINIYDNSGKYWLSMDDSKTNSFYQKQFNLSSLPPGSYYIQIVYEKKKATIKKFMKQ